MRDWYAEYLVAVDKMKAYVSSKCMQHIVRKDVCQVGLKEHFSCGLGTFQALSCKTLIIP